MIFILLLKILLALSYYSQVNTKNYHPYPEIKGRNNGYVDFNPAFYLSKYILNLGSLSLERHKFYEFSLFDDKKNYTIETNGLMKESNINDLSSDTYFFVSVLPIDTDSSLTFEPHDQTCNNMSIIHSNLIKQCDNMKKCEINFSKEFFKQSCFESGYLNGKKMSLKVKSLPEKVKLLHFLEIKEELFTTIYVGVCAFIFALLAVHTRRLYQKQVNEVVKKRIAYPSPSDYTVEIKNFPLGTSKTEQDILFNVKTYISKVFFESDFKKKYEEVAENDEEGRRVKSYDFVIDIYTTFDNEKNVLNGKIFNTRKEIQEKYEHLLHVSEMLKRGVKKKFPEKCLYFKKIEEIVNINSLNKGNFISEI